MSEKTIKLGLIGAGYVAGEHMKVINAHPAAKAVGLTSRTPEKASAFAKEHGIPETFKDMSSMVETARPDALMVMVPPEKMFEVSREALSFGLPVFMEKPAGLKPDEHAKLARIARENNVKTMVGFNRRFYSVFKKGMEIIEKNGPLYGLLIEGHERINAVRACGKFKEETIANWIYANGTHTIDLLRFFGGEIADICIRTGSRQEKNGDQFSASVEFENGALGTYVSNWLSPGGWRVALYGKGVSVEFSPLEKGIWTDSEFKRHDIVPDPLDVDYKPGFYRQLDCFCKLILHKDTTFHLDLESSLPTMELARSFTTNA